MDKIPWQVYVGIIVFAIIAFLVMVIIVISNNKNISANAEHKDNKLGFSITDSESSSKKDNKKNTVNLNNDQMTNILLSNLNTLKTHPLFTSVFGNILYKSDLLLDKTRHFVFESVLSQTQTNKKNRILILNDLYKYYLIVNTLFKNYIVSFKSVLNKLIDDAEHDITSNDPSFKQTLNTYNIFLEDIVSNNLINAVVDNFKSTGASTNDYVLNPEDIPEEIYNMFKGYIKDELDIFYRDMLICKNLIFSIDSNLYKRYTYFITGLSQFFNSVLHYTVILFYQTRFSFFMKIYDIYNLNNKSKSEIEDVAII